MSVVITKFDPNLAYLGQKQFDCEHTVINKFVHQSLKAQVKKNLSVAYILLDTSKDDRFVGFYTLAQHTIDVSLISTLSLGSLPQKIPCSRIIMLGIDKNYKKMGYGLDLMRHAFILTKTVAQQIGSFGLYLDADPLAVDFYLGLGLVLLGKRDNSAPSPMFIPMSAISET